MRVLSVLTVITTVSFALVTAASTKFDAPTSRSDIELATRVSVDHNQVNRVLRRFIPNDEERGVVDKVDDVVTKLDDVTGIRKVDDATGKAKVTSHLDTLMLKNLHELSEQAALGIKLSSKYKNAGQLSLPTLRQLDEIEILKKADVAKYSKETGKSMRREIPDFPGKKTAPAKFLESHVGRDQQRYGADGSRLLASAVVYDPVTERVLLISSSNPNKNELLTIKGGWDYGENVEKAALREVMEEGGVR
ncbi:RxLR effector protein [Phytophthora megakarya]|uniref:RxLR effector protein n=1 Tax=Phytophthora megakarya TaxID=4795 RepID=A0A225VH55_9STRA|nr:RxLR effector protein [Phytophthora megakarya]